jgi:hypothetical protein
LKRREGGAVPTIIWNVRDDLPATDCHEQGYPLDSGEACGSH